MTHTHGGGLAEAASNPAQAVTGGDRRTLDAIFQHPLSHNLSWREVVALVTAIGATEEKHNGEFLFSAGDQRLSMKRPHGKDLTASEVIDLRHFLKRAGWSPDAAVPSPADPAEAAPGLIIVIDHTDARIYRIDRAVDDRRAITAYDPKHLLHHLERKMHDEDRGEAFPDDEAFFERIADAASSGGEIVVVGHGKGQSNEADHLSAYLKRRHPGTYARIVREIVADLPHLTTPELLELGRHAFG
jgi:hypothetical protein